MAIAYGTAQWHEVMALRFALAKFPPIEQQNDTQKKATAILCWHVFDATGEDEDRDNLWPIMQELGCSVPT